MAPIILAILGPIGTVVGNGIGQGFINFYLAYGWLAGAVLGALYPFLVILGMHVGFTPVMIQSLAKYGVDYMMALFVASNSAQAGATFAVFTKTKNKEFKSLAGTAALNAFIGITEPALFGVTSRLKRPLIAVSIAGAIGGAIAGFFRVEALGMGTGPIAGIPLFLGKTFIYYVISSLVALILGYVLTIVIGFEDIPEENVTSSDSIIVDEEKNITNALADQVISSPITGQVIALNQVSDNVFASGVMGKGVAIIPSEGKIYSPVDGSVELVFETKHAIGLKSLDGAEILIHVGLDTVELNGGPFTVHVQAGQIVKKGDLLLDVDLEAIKASGKETVTPVIVTNSANFAKIDVKTSVQIKVGEDLLTLEV